jgi:integrase
MTDEMEKEIERRVQTELKKVKDKPKKTKKTQKIKLPMTRQQILDFLNTFPGKTATSKRNRLYFKTSLDWGARSIEVRNAKYSNLLIDSDGDPYLHLRSEYSKSGREDFLPMTIELYNELLDLKKIYKSKNQDYIFSPISKNEPIQASYIRRLANEHGKLAGIPFPVGTHTCRRSFGYHMLKKTNGDIFTVSKLLRHANINSSMPYLKMFMDDKKAAIKGFNLTSSIEEDE